MPESNIRKAKKINVLFATIPEDLNSLNPVLPFVKGQNRGMPDFVKRSRNKWDNRAEMQIKNNIQLLDEIAAAIDKNAAENAE